jgi:hypothetical protein
VDVGLAQRRTNTRSALGLLLSTYSVTTTEWKYERTLQSIVNGS